MRYRAALAGPVLTHLDGSQHQSLTVETMLVA
jgi:hypothetical protein